jgi:hypothetical protein
MQFVARIVIAGMAFHVTQQGNDRQRFSFPDAELWDWRLDWTADLRRGQNAVQFGELCCHSRNRRPLASVAFLDELDAKLKRRLRPLAVGRPKKMPKENKDQEEK